MLISLTGGRIWCIDIDYFFLTFVSSIEMCDYYCRRQNCTRPWYDLLWGRQGAPQCNGFDFRRHRILRLS
jgi:hypothetical protein